MKDVRYDFPMLKQNIIYFDNGATTFKPYKVIEKMNDYYYNYSANAHRGDYNISYKVDVMYESSRKKVADFINQPLFITAYSIFYNACKSRNSYRNRCLPKRLP